MPTREELEQMVCEQIDHELFTPDEKRFIRSMVSEKGAGKIIQIAKETAKGGDAN